MIICKKCKKVVSYNSYFQKYICNNCGWECKEDAETNIKENIKIVNTIIENSNNIMSDLRECEVQAIENILADRERLIEDIKIQEDNYQMLSESVSNIAKELDLEEDATIDEIYTAIRILKSKRINMFEQLDYINNGKKAFYYNKSEMQEISVKKVEEKTI